MEFYKLYKDCVNYFGYYNTGICIDELNEEIKCNPQWMSEVVSQTTNCTENGTLITLLVRWVGLSSTPFKENNDG